MEFERILAAQQSLQVFSDDRGEQRAFVTTGDRGPKYQHARQFGMAVWRIGSVEDSTGWYPSKEGQEVRGVPNSSWPPRVRSDDCSSIACSMGGW